MEQDPNKTYIVSLSGGKDSIAMGLMLLEKGYRVDEFVFCDTGYEFPECYDALCRFERLTGRTITRLKYKHSFEYLLCDAPRRPSRTMKEGSYIKPKDIGYGWPTFRYRWCTGFLKKNLAHDFVKKFPQPVTYVGIAFDEPDRIREEPDKEYPLHLWRITEAECLEYCKKRGFYQSPCAYDYCTRMSCFVCPLNNMKSIFYLIEHRPELWAEIKRLEAKVKEPWKVLEQKHTSYYEARYKAFKSKPIQDEFDFN